MVPRSLPWEQVICRTPRTAVALTAARAWTTHLTLEAGFFFSTPMPEQERLLFYRDDDIRPRSVSPEPDVPRLAVVFADGRYATNVRRPGYPRSHDRGLCRRFPVLTLASAGGGGGGGETTGRWHYRQAVDVWPLPPAGPLNLVFSWPAEEMGERSVELSGDAVAEAAAQCVDVYEPR